MIETHGIYTVSYSTHSSPSMSLITRSSELAWLLQLKFTQPHTYVHGKLLFRQLHVLLYPLEYNDVWSCQTPNHERPEKGGVDIFPQPFSKSLLRNVLVKYAVLVSQRWRKTLSLSFICVVGVEEPPNVVHFGVYVGCV